MNNRIEEHELLRRVAELPREIAPQNDPWDVIAARLEPRESQQRLHGWTQAWGRRAAVAAVVLAFFAGIIIGPRLSGRPEPATDTPVVAVQPTVTQPALRLPAALAASEAEYLAAFREFIEVGQARASLSTQTVANIETGWADLREVERALTDALARNPDDRFLNRRMQELRARQLGFLQQLASLDQSNRRLTI